MAGIWGDGQRGGIFGAKVDPRLQAELERRAAAQRQEMQPGLVDQWRGSLANRILSAPSKLFGGLVVDPAMDLATLAGDVIHGRQPTMAADPQTGEFHTDPRLADRAMNAAGMLTLGAGAIPAEANSLRMGIKAYHGSPHDFAPEPGYPLGRFRSDKIGTGEGNQAFGYGHYTAEREGVAQEYRDKLTHRNFINEAQDPRKVGEALFDVEARDGGLIDGKIPFGPTRGLKTREQIADMFASGEASAFDLRPAMQKKINEFMKPPGKMYEVDIAADPEHFLDWDKPLSEQPEMWKRLLKSTGKTEDELLALNEKWGQLSQQVLDAPQGTPEYDALMAQWDDMRRDPHLRIAEIFEESQRAKHWSNPKARTGEGLVFKLGRGESASQALREAGIPGIRYLDQGSRDPQKMKELADDLAQYKEAAKHWAETGNSEKLAIAQKQIEVLTKRISETRNYVVFPGNEHLIAILKKYGLPISAAGLAALSLLHPQEAQAAQRSK